MIYRAAGRRGVVLVGGAHREDVDDHLPRPLHLQSWWGCQVGACTRQLRLTRRSHDDAAGPGLCGEHTGALHEMGLYGYIMLKEGRTPRTMPAAMGAVPV